ncbi:hypothetical protein CAPTEDRAFT_165789 [Capitella teleta]|uniref:Ubiquitin-like protease family profile domain-containing protein n=1 Tax=Capitella teleta TaxID=283909 RepID=R7V350_CAPTE|nr:hypothetical protein CAPTEDRAFT_165789 [Capitella teleta]|eukprot:ELU13268.1 hypothetical protein CAPTEDRAFT_165789 [Capitella teleta]
MLSEEQQQKTHLFSSFFYRRLTQKQSRRQTNEDQANMSLPERRHSRVKTWTRHVDIFSKDFIIVPINESAHWYLAIICFPWLQKPIVAAKTVKEEQDSTSTPASNSTSESTEAALQSSEGSQESAAEEKPKTPAQTKTAAKAAARILKSSTYIAKQPCILIFDSLSGLGRSGVVRTLREYIQTEWNMRKGSTEGMRLYDKDNMRGANPKCPQQTNFSDCGIYVLQYVECFFRSPIKDYGIPMNLSNWFEESEAKHKREDLRLLILGLQQELNPDLKYDPTKDGCLPELPTAATSLDESMDASQSSSS